MKRFILTLLSLLYPLLSNAIVINSSVFVRNGGDLSDIDNTIVNANEGLVEKSNAKDFSSVGYLPKSIVSYAVKCTATWLGNDDSGWTYILTAAHCVPYDGQETPVANQELIGSEGETVAEGDGFVYVPEDLINPPQGRDPEANDIAILKLPTIEKPLDKDGKLVEQPIINDNFNDELNKKVMFVGYGQWGVGLSTSHIHDLLESRLYGESVITELVEMDYGMSAPYEPEKEATEAWARTAPHDSGSAWWQEVKGHKVIVAIDRGHLDTASVAVRVSKYVPWIQGIYKDVRLLSNEPNESWIPLVGPIIEDVQNSVSGY